MKKTDTQKLVLTAILAAVLVLMAFTPLGYLNVNALNISFNMIPVAIGAIALGPTGGAVLGLVFGLTSFSRCFGLTALGTTLCGISIVRTFVLCVVPRVLDGFLIGLVYKLMSRRIKNSTVNFAVTGFLSAALNTVLYMSALVILFGNTDVIQSYWSKLAEGKNAIVFIAAFVGVNALVEMAAATLITAAVAFALKKARLISCEAAAEMPAPQQ